MVLLKKTAFISRCFRFSFTDVVRLILLSLLLLLLGIYCKLPVECASDRILILNRSIFAEALPRILQALFSGHSVDAIINAA